MSYLVSPIWLTLLLVWAVIGVGEEKSLIVYFSGNDPRPQWPELTGGRQVALLAVMYGLLLAPKLAGALWTATRAPRTAAFGGGTRFALSVLSEVLLSVAYAPILMVQQTRAVVASAIGAGPGWSTYRAAPGRRHSVGALARFHAAETMVGLALTLGLAFGYVTPWLAPIAVSLLLAVPLSRLSGVRISHLGSARHLMATPEHLAPPRIARRARSARARLAAALERPLGIAAE